MRKEGTESGCSSDSGTWFNLGEGFAYPPGIFTDLHYTRTSEEEGGEEPEVNFNTHHQNNDTNDSMHESMPEYGASTIEKLKIHESTYYPIISLQGTDVSVRTRSQTGTLTW